MIYPVILCGGEGIRLWPLSSPECPKQMLNLYSDKSLLQETLLRLMGDNIFARPIIVTNNKYRFLVAEHIRQLGLEDIEIIVEPESKNTAPAIITAALLIMERDKEANIIVLPSDHKINNNQKFIEEIKLADQLARKNNKFVLFGIKPLSPHNGYGYIQFSDESEYDDIGYRIIKFTEKPSEKIAEEYIQQGYYWNSGIFLMPIKLLLSEMKQYNCDMVDYCSNSINYAKRDTNFIYLENINFSKNISQSIDYTLIEKTCNAILVKASFNWHDIGSWLNIWEVSEKDVLGNVCIGNVKCSGDAKNNYLLSTDKPLAVIGVENIAVIHTENGTLVVPMDKAQDVKSLFEIKQ